MGKDKARGVERLPSDQCSTNDSDGCTTHSDGVEHEAHEKDIQEGP